jgi:hypothetical protein
MPTVKFNLKELLNESYYQSKMQGMSDQNVNTIAGTGVGTQVLAGTVGAVPGAVVGAVPGAVAGGAVAGPAGIIPGAGYGAATGGTITAGLSVDEMQKLQRAAREEQERRGISPAQPEQKLHNLTSQSDEDLRKDLNRMEAGASKDFTKLSDEELAKVVQSRDQANSDNSNAVLTGMGGVGGAAVGAGLGALTGGVFDSPEVGAAIGAGLGGAAGAGYVSKDLQSTQTEAIREQLRREQDKAAQQK